MVYYITMEALNQHHIEPIKIVNGLYKINNFLPKEKFYIIYNNVLSSPMARTVCSIRI